MDRSTFGFQKAGGPKYYYKFIPLIIFKTGLYHFFIKSPINFYYNIYMDHFYPLQPSKNLIDSTYIRPGAMQFEMTAYFLKNTTYILVPIKFNFRRGQSFSIVVDGESALSLVHATDWIFSMMNSTSRQH